MNNRGCILPIIAIQDTVEENVTRDATSVIYFSSYIGHTQNKKKLQKRSVENIPVSSTAKEGETSLKRAGLINQSEAHQHSNHISVLFYLKQEEHFCDLQGRIYIGKTRDTMQPQTILYLSGSPIALNVNYKVDCSLLKNDEKLAFNLHTRTIILLDEKHLVKQEEILSPIEAHLFLFLLHFYPYYAPDTMLGQACDFADLDTYYSQLLVAQKREVSPEKICLDAIQDGMERLRKKLFPFGLSTIRIRHTGYSLCTCPLRESPLRDPHKKAFIRSAG